LAAFAEAEAATGPVYDIADIAADQHLQEREAIVRHDGILMQGLIAKLSRTPGTLRLPAPAKGEHTEAVLREAGYEGEPLARLLARAGLSVPAAAPVSAGEPGES